MLRHDAFLSDILGKPAFSVVTPEERDFSGGEAGFAYAKVASDRVADCAKLTALDFRLIDTSVQMQLQLPLRSTGGAVLPIPSDCVIREARPSDAVAVARMAQCSFQFSRFHLDPQVPKATAHEIKRRWALNFFSGLRGNFMVVVESCGEVCGFLQAIMGKGVLIVDLIAVTEAQRGNGFAGAMIRHAVTHVKEPISDVIVGTQVANTTSVRAYEKLGFRLHSAQYVFHYHGPLRPPHA